MFWEQCGNMWMEEVAEVYVMNQIATRSRELLQARLLWRRVHVQ